MAAPAISPDFLLVPDTTTRLSHVRPIDAGGGGEVHEVQDGLVAILIHV
jgi:hypothetical protein